MSQHILERNLLRKFERGEDHPGDPEINNIVTGNEQARRVETFQIFGLLRPAKRRERP
ncbi:hypothetical protein D3C85_1658780 [compost metagenome]